MPYISYMYAINGFTICCVCVCVWKGVLILLLSIVWHRLDYVESAGTYKVCRTLIRILFYIDLGGVPVMSYLKCGKF